MLTVLAIVVAVLFVFWVRALLMVGSAKSSIELELFKDELKRGRH